MDFSWEMGHHLHGDPWKCLATLTVLCVCRFLEARWDTPEELEVLGLLDLQTLREKEDLLHVKKRWSTKTNDGLGGPSDLYK